MTEVIADNVQGLDRARDAEPADAATGNGPDEGGFPSPPSFLQEFRFRTLINGLPPIHPPFTWLS